MKLYGTDRSEEDLQEALQAGEIPVAVYGLGKMGLPLAAVYADVTGNVTGVDIDPAVVDAVAAGESHIEREPGLDELVETTVTRGALSATTDAAQAAADASVHVIIVPTLVDDEGQVDLSALDAVVESIGSGIDRGDLVVIESTVPPRTSVDRIEPEVAERGVVETGEFGVAFCPERTSSGRALEDIRGAYPKIVGGVDEESTKAATVLYEDITDNDVIDVSDATTAETVKVLEGVYRDVNIALANELAGYVDALDIDLLEAIEAANTNPYCDIHRPGAGVGGHCIPYYPYFLTEEFDVPSTLMETAREVNDSMPAFVIDKLLQGLNYIGKQVADSTILVLGLTYRPGVKEIRHSPAIPVVERLVGQGAAVYVTDPLVTDLSEFEGSVQVAIDDVYNVSPDGVVLITDHEEFGEIDYSRFDDSLAIVDGRQAIDVQVGRHWVYTIGMGLTNGRGSDQK